MISASEARRGRPRPRIGLALGAGGVLGAAWATGALATLQKRVPVPVGECDVIVGTSAGSVLAAALRCGLTVDEIVSYQREGPSGPLRALGSPDLGYGAMPPWPRMVMGSPRLLLAALRSPHTVHPWVIASACLPEGRGDHAALQEMVRDMALLGDQRRAPSGGAWARLIGRTSAADPAHPANPGSAAGPGWLGRLAGALAPGRSAPAAGADAAASLVTDWADQGRTWIVAVDYDLGHRVVFGRGGAPRASLPDAVAASCSVPGWFRPTVIGDRRYVDGGVRSTASADLLTGLGLDEVYVLAPMASVVTAPPRTALERAERMIRRRMTAATEREIDLLRSEGVTLTLLTPGPEDLRAMGGNLMDPARRQDVFETSLRTSAESFGAPDDRAA
jgi:NTE family protein